MKKTLLCSLSILFFKVSLAQLVATGSTPVNLVQNVLLGAGVTASNITYTGYANSISEFTAPASGNLGITNGVYLTSGSYLQNDPNNWFSLGEDGPAGPSGNFQSIDNGFPGDPILDAISGNTTYDAAILEFDFVPQSDTVKFRYTFGSEEYNDFVSTSPGGVNDAFAFILSGVSTPLAPVNIALLPGTTTPVSIFTVNNGNSFGASTGPCTNCTYYRDNFNGSIDVVYDGLTTVLTAVHPVICGETYHIKIMISDAGDGAYDSGVFLEAGSFSSSVPFSVASNVNGDATDTVAVEGCDNMEIVFVRPSNATATAANYTVTIGGAATNGVDYPAIPSVINFPVGEDSVVYSFIPILDGIAEGTEDITITINNVNVCGVITSVTYTFLISDMTPIAITTTNGTVCPGVSADISVSATGGSGNYTYTWNTGATNDTITVNPAGTTQYTVTVDDDCPGTLAAQGTSIVTVIPAFTLSVPPQTDTYCNNSTSALITAQCVPPVPGSWSGTGITDIGNQQGTFNPSTLPIGQNIFTYDAGTGGCNSSVQFTVTINQYTDPSFTAQPPACSYDPPVTFVADNGGGQWFINNSSFNGIANPSILGAGTYQIKYVTGVPACPDSSTHPFIITPKPNVSFTADTTEGCLIGGNTFSFTSQLSNLSVPNGSYQWSFGDGPGSGSTQMNPSHTYAAAAVYSVYLSYIDPNGCLDDTTAFSMITVHPHPHADFYFSNETPTILEPTVDLINLSGAAGNTFDWNVADLFTSTDQNITFEFPNAGNFPATLMVTNQFGCSDSITRMLNVANEEVLYIPNAFSPNADGKNDYFFPKGFGLNEKEDYRMQIFNRWGERIFDTSDYKVFWNGSLNNTGNGIIEDTYIYIINYKDLANKKHKQTGHVTIVR